MPTQRMTPRDETAARATGARPGRGGPLPPRPLALASALLRIRGDVVEVVGITRSAVAHVPSGTAVYSNSRVAHTVEPTGYG